MKLHRHLCQSVVIILKDIFQGDRYADKVLEYHFKNNKKWGARDRRFVAEAVYDIVRWWRRLWFALGREPSFQDPELWEILGTWLIAKGEELPPWAEFRNLKVDKIISRYEKPENPAVRHSVPDWIYERGHQELGEEWPKALEAMNRQADVVLRANTLKTTPKALRDLLAKEEIETELNATYPDAVILLKRANVFKTQAFQDGMFEVQDASSQCVARLLDPQPGMRVIDACAGAGGKSLHLAALMKNKGKIISMDVSDPKLSELRKRASRAGADIIECRVIDSSKAIKRLENTADALLLDVPCSGSGVWKRNPDSRWKLSIDELERVQALQWEILSQYTRMLKPGGVLVYATCSIFPSENEKQVSRFLSENSNWKLLEERTYLPHQSGFDGFFMCKLQRTS